MIALLQTTTAALGPASDAVICAATLGLYAVLWGLADWWGRRPSITSGEGRKETT